MALAAVMLALAGVGRVVMDVSGRSLLQRAVSADLLARAFGVMEGLFMASLAVGSILASAFVAWFGARGALLAIGALLPVITAGCWRSLRRIETRSAPPEDVVRLLRGVPMFEPLPALVPGAPRHERRGDGVAGRTRRFSRRAGRATAST